MVSSEVVISASFSMKILDARAIYGIMMLAT